MRRRRNRGKKRRQLGKLRVEVSNQQITKTFCLVPPTRKEGLDELKDGTLEVNQSIN